MPGKPTAVDKEYHEADYVPDPSQMFAEMMAMHLERGEYAIAHRLIDKYESEAKERAKRDPYQVTRDTPVAELGLPTVATEALERSGVIYVHELLKLNRKSLLSIPRINGYTADRILERLRRFTLVGS
jgi:DNA-directed RNA polymerase alpha subunit